MMLLLGGPGSSGARILIPIGLTIKPGAREIPDSAVPFEGVLYSI